ncbi:MAG: MFS transporter [Patescibacteria group bacterium]
MPTIHQLTDRFRISGFRRTPLYAFSFVIFFWAIFDGILSYAVPLLITEHGLSETAMGLLISTSSIVGALFDFMICRLFRDTHFRRVLLFVFILCFIYPIILGNASTVWLFLAAMAVWGLYFNLVNIASFDFIGRFTRPDDHASHFGVLNVFRMLGYTLAPLIAGLTIGLVVGWKPLFVAWFFLVICLLCYVALLLVTRKKKYQPVNKTPGQRLNFLAELHLWKRIGRRLLPVLLITMILSVFDSYFWTIGPIFAEKISGPGQFTGLLLVAYQFPALLVGWYVGSVTRRLGKKRTAFFALLCASAIILTLGFVHQFALTIVIVFVASFFIALAWPSINGAYADYISEAPRVEKEIASLADFFANLGFVIGPILAGLLAESFGESMAFSLLGLGSIIVILFINRITPKHISVHKI